MACEIGGSGIAWRCSARALALIVLLAGYETLIFAERLALPALAVERIPRTVAWRLMMGVSTKRAGG